MDEDLTCKDCVFYETGHCIDSNKSVSDNDEMCWDGSINDKIYTAVQKGREPNEILF